MILQGAAVVADMVTFLITSFLVLAFIGIAIYFWQKPRPTVEVDVLRSPPGRGLFSDRENEHQLLAASGKDQNTLPAAERDEILRAAKAGEKSALQAAHNSRDPQLYSESLDLLVESADSNPGVLALTSYVTRHELPVNKKLAEAVIASCKTEPDRVVATKMLHIAALADDAEVYQKAVETALSLFRNHRLNEMSASELRSILDGEFWILSSATRSSGAGFLLKRTLTNARRELVAASNE